MKITVLITSNNIEKAWNALRLMNTFLAMEHQVSAFLINGGVETEFIDHQLFDIQKNWQLFFERGGIATSCGTCLDFRKLTDRVQKNTIGNLIDCANLVENADKVLTF
ncbi:DsrE family protein [Orbus sturtevantii]|uniref:DsrE family protein n=1 Tax=Orbus sturtevantii TaxID=3074109 RepID=UPI00370D9776